jgi:hypothetical protein
MLIQYLRHVAESASVGTRNERRDIISHAVCFSDAGSRPDTIDQKTIRTRTISVDTERSKDDEAANNAFFTELGQGAVRRAQYGQSLTISHPLVNGFTLSGEIWHFTQPFLRSNAVGNLWAVSYVARKNLVLDAGFNHGLTRTSTQWEAFVRFTYCVVMESLNIGTAEYQK